MESSEDPLTSEQRNALRAAIGNTGLTDYLRDMCGVEVTIATEAMLTSWWKIQLENVQHNLDIAWSKGYIKGKNTGRRGPICLN